MNPRDITRRVLGRPMHSPYMPGGGVPSRRLWWWVGGFLWLAWIALLSDHSLWRIFRLKQELRAANVEIAQIEGATRKLDAQMSDPHARAEQSEEILRKQGMARPGEIVYRLGGDADSSRR